MFKYHCYFALLLFILTTSCRDIVERDISKASVSVLTPVDNLKTSQSVIHFKWNEVTDAIDYKIEIVSPSFPSISNFLVDSTVTGREFQYQLPQGTYQWRVRAQNGSSKTDFTTYTLTVTVDTSIDLSKKLVTLISPANNYITNKKAQNFRWYKINEADDYRFEVLSGSTVIYSNSATTLDSISFTFLSEGTYQWRVRAQNSKTVSPYSSNSITIDITPPSAPSLLFPLNADTSSVPVKLKWHRYSAATIDSVAVDSSSLFTSPALTKYAVTDTMLSLTGLVKGKFYYWKVRSLDNAGNASGYSQVRSFKTK